MDSLFWSELKERMFYRTFLYDGYCHLYNRFLTKVQYLRTGLPKGTYYDLEDRVTYALFNTLVEFVEVELAHIVIVTRKDQKFEKVSKWYQPTRSPDAGLYYLNSTEFGDVKSNKKILDLYKWWVEYLGHLEAERQMTVKAEQQILETYVVRLGHHDTDAVYEDVMISPHLTYEALSSRSIVLFQQRKKMLKKMIDILPSLWT